MAAAREAHNAQTVRLGAALSVLTFVVLRGGGRPARARHGLATELGSTYRVTQLSALVFPGTALIDPPPKRGPQGIIAVGVVVLNVLAFLLVRGDAMRRAAD